MNNTTATMDAAASIDSDLEKALWNETPETNYFKMMMEDNEMGRIGVDGKDGTDDSVLGGETLASLMGDKDSTNTHNSSNNKSKDSNTKKKVVDSSSKDASSFPTETMAIVGLDDDVSTIANDTVNETTKSFFDGPSSKHDPKPRVRLFKEYRRTEQAKKKSESSTENAEDDETAPETPPGMIRVHEKSKKGGMEDDESAKVGKGDVPPPGRSKRVYIFAAVMGIILVASIIALTVALASIKDDDSPSTSTSASNSDNGDGENVPEDWPDLNTTINEPTDPPLDDEETIAPTVDQGGPVPIPPPSDGPFDEVAFDDMLTILVDRGAVSSDLPDNPDSPQYQALTWIAGDPSYFSYSEDRAVQRYALAVLAYSLKAPEQGGTGRRAQARNMTEWLDYTDECTWFTTSEESSICDSSGMYEIIDIRNYSLEGSLPTDVALLSNSLRSLNLDGNAIQGQIPTEFGTLSLLESLTLRRNSLTGTIVTELGKLSSLEILELGSNEFSGAIPPAIGNVRALTALGLQFNFLTGQIPRSFERLIGLTELRLNDNALSGSIPNQIAQLANLEVLTLENNDFSGDVPTDVCRIDGLQVLTVDCDEVNCQCCTSCSEGLTDAPTAPAASPVASSGPPAASPSTAGPTQCSDAVRVVSTCFAPGDDIVVLLSNCNPEDDDWIALYGADDDITDLPNPDIWSWACGSRFCREAITTSTIALNEEHAQNGQWFLDEGTYKVVLARNSAQPYTAYAVSTLFNISNSC